MTREDQWREVGARSADAVVALLKLRAATESLRLISSQAMRAASASSPDVPEDLTKPVDAPAADERAALLRRVLWGCGHAWFRASREVADLPPLEVTPALAAGYDPDAVGKWTLAAGRMPGGVEKVGKHTADAMRETLAPMRAVIQAMRGMEDPTLDIVADELADLVRAIHGPLPE